MRCLSICLFVAACGAGTPAIERRVSDLEAKPAPAKDPAVERLERRIAELEKYQRRQASELKELQEVVHKLGDQLADSLAAQPLPSSPPSVPPPTTRRSLDPALVYPVPLDDSPQLGQAAAAVTLVAAVQFPEPFTHKSWPVLQQLQAEYGKDLRLVIKSFVVHPQATESTIAACAVASQHKLDGYETKLWIASMAAGSRRWPDAAESRDLARDAGIDLKKFDRDVAHGCRDALARDQKMFTQLGQSGVPTFWINGRPLSGAQPVEAFKAVIDDEKTKALADRKKGGKAQTYYDRMIANGARP